MADEILDYQKMTQDALRDVVRRSLVIASRDGLPGEHHFFIAFSTGAPGVNISSRLRERHPEEMTIVLQHQFWGLEVTQDKFTIKLSFNNTPETLVVPFLAIKGFLDPSVQFGLQFDIGPPKAEEVGNAATALAAPAETAEPATPAGQSAVPGSDTEDDQDADPADTEAAQVVSLDAFRKK